MLLLTICGQNWTQDNSSDIDKEELDYAIAISLSEVDHKGKKVIGKATNL